MSAIKPATALIIAVATPIIAGVLIALVVFVIDAALRLERGPKTQLLCDWCYHKDQITNIHLLAIAHVYTGYAIALIRVVDFSL